MNKGAVYHRADSEWCYLGDDGLLTIVLRAARGDLQGVQMVYDDRYDAKPKRPWRRLMLEKRHSAGGYDYFQMAFQCPYSRIGYFFLLTAASGETAYFYQDGFSEQYSWGRQRLFQLPYLHPEDTPRVPQWLKESVAYQVFPDSFAQGRGRMEPAPAERTTPDGRTVSSRLGGTLRGVIENLPYLRELGVNLLYLNPIFTALSYHKYDTIEYYHIDPCLGTDEDFKELVAQCHAMGIRVMLDLVFNHMSREHPFFRDVLEKGEGSPYADWFCIHRFPVKDEQGHHYESFAFLEEMPKLNTANPKAADYLLSVARYWLREYGVDGYRLDVANEVSHTFWRRFRREMEAVRPDVAIIGEVWHEAPEWIGRDQFHSVMNYPLLYAVWGFFGQDSLQAQDFTEIIGRLALLYRRDNVAAMMNFLDNHDTCRFYSICGHQRPRLRLAAAFLLSYVGMPLLFYGDEAALDGGNELESRQAMKWQLGAEDRELADWFRLLIHTRRAHPALLRGDFRSAGCDPLHGTAAFWREAGQGQERVLCLFHNAQDAAAYPLPEGAAYTDLLTGERFSGGEAANLAPFGARLLAASSLREASSHKEASSFQEDKQ